MKLVLRTPLLSKVYEVVPLPSIEMSSMRSILKYFLVYSYVGCVPKRLAANGNCIMRGRISGRVLVRGVATDSWCLALIYDPPGHAVYRMLPAISLVLFNF